MTFVEGDALLHPDMRARVEKFLPPTREQLAYLVDALQLQIAFIASAATNQGVVVSQALYRNEHRLPIIDYWKASGYDVECFWVRPGFWQNAKQLWNRRRGLRWTLYWLVSKPWFEKPDHPAVEHPNTRL